MTTARNRMVRNRPRLRRGILTARGRAEPSRASRGEVVVRAEGVTVRRGGRPILSGVDLDATAGRLLVLVGPNGAGKSTLLQVLGGDVRPESGRVRLFDRDVGAWPAVDAARRRAVLPQQNGLSFPFTVRDVVAMGRTPWRNTPAAADDDAVVAAAMAATDVTDLAGRRYPSLSGGESARVSLARVLAQCTPVLLLDEPTAALDPHHQEAVFVLLRQRADAGDAVVVVGHDLGLAAAYADEVAVLGGGRLRACGPPETVLTDVLLSDVYRQPMEVVPHPRTGRPVITPYRSATPGAVRAPAAPVRGD